MENWKGEKGFEGERKWKIRSLSLSRSCQLPGKKAWRVKSSLEIIYYKPSRALRPFYCRLTSNAECSFDISPNTIAIESFFIKVFAENISSMSPASHAPGFSETKMYPNTREVNKHLETEKPSILAVFCLANPRSVFKWLFPMNSKFVPFPK